MNIIDKETFEQLKSSFLESNKKFINEVNRLTPENCNEIENRLTLTTFHTNAIESYHQFVRYIRGIK